MPNYVTDTHGLVWYLTSDARLGREAKVIFAACERGEVLIFVPTISLVEIIYLQEKRKIPENLHAQFTLVINSDRFGLRIADLTHEIAAALAQIPRAAVPDMPDRIIAATALHLGVPLISRDRIIQLSEVETVW
ncbi:MAG: PIN domain-containing protein [Chloroflexi bacterium]|nr:MAG: PIN domain-containing protein [Chloroflexota bacterium]